MFSLMENGHLKSTLLMYSFALSFVFLAIYVLMYFLLLQPLDALLAGHAETGIINLIESFVPSLLASLVCLLSFLIVREKKIIPIAFVFILIYALGILFLILFGEGSDGSLLHIFALFVPIPVLLGCVSSVGTYLLYVRKKG